MKLFADFPYTVIFLQCFTFPITVAVFKNMA